MHRVLEDETIADEFAAATIEGLTGVEVSEQEVRTYRKLLKPDFLRSSPYAEGTKPLPTAVRKPVKVPEWADSPGYSVEGDQGTIVTAPRLVTSEDQGEHDDADELREFGFDPEIWEVAWAKRSNWQAQNGDWLESRKLTVRKRDSRRLQLENVNEIFAAYADQPPVRLQDDTKHRTVLIALGDTQAGKVDGGGSESLVARFARILGDIAAWLRSTGGCERLILAWAGDCIEGVVSQNGKLITRLDLSVTEQVRLVSRMIMHEVGIFAPLCDKMLVASVPGNHDESHRVAATKPGDSWAIQAASSVADALDLMGGYEHVEWLFPEDESSSLAVSVGTDEHPYVIGLTHGHICKNVNNVTKWMAGQALGRQPVGEADLLITGHWHHLRTEFVSGGRTWCQLPSMDGGSTWFTEARGVDTPAGAVTMEIDPTHAPGWENLKVWS